MPLAVSSLAPISCGDGSPASGSGSVSQTAVTVSPVSGTSTTPFVFTGEITTTGPAEVTYRWAHDDGSMSPVATLTFSDASTQTVTHTWDTVGCSTTQRSRRARLVIVSPNAMNSTETFVTVSAATSC